jgi:glyoxylase-like metal-dependent hydrolase (beta-lactamase superfamily II)
MLLYPVEGRPAPGQALEVAPGVLWLRKAVPGGVNHVNVWALADGDAWTLVDTGIQTTETAASWEAAFSIALAGRPVSRVICTHMHPDHIGMAGWLTRRFDCQLWITRLEYVTCRMLTLDAAREAPADAIRFYRAAGWDEGAIRNYRAQLSAFGQGVYALPDSFRRVTDGDELEIGGRMWRAVVGRGHSPEHLCLYCAELALLISGDQVLPRITSNVSVHPDEPEANPLADWLASIATLSRRVSDDVLVLPSHNEPFRGLHTRLRQLNDWHEDTLGRLRQALRERKRATNVFDILFHRPVSSNILTFATGEALAHLNYLLRRGEIAREIDAEGVAWYAAV